MNKTVELYCAEMDKATFGWFLIYIFEIKPEAYQTIKEIYLDKGLKADPWVMVKFTVRTTTITFKGQKFNLQEMRKVEDPYEIVNFWKFMNVFGYSEDDQAFIPKGLCVQGTRWLKSFYKERQEKHIKEVWEEAKMYLCSPEGKEPALKI